MLGLKTIGLFLLVLFCLTAHGQTWQWAKSATSSTSIGSAEGYSVATDASGNVFVTGYFSSPTITFGSITLTNSGGSDVFLTKYNSAGIVLWARSIQGTGTDICYSDN